MEVNRIFTIGNKYNGFASMVKSRFSHCKFEGGQQKFYQSIVKMIIDYEHEQEQECENENARRARA
jgi:hypothetical protein